MVINERSVGDVAILEIHGRMTMHEGDEKFKEAIDRLVNGGKKKILVNYEACFYVDSTALADLIRGYTLTNKSGGDLKLLRLSKRVRDLLSATKLLRVFEVFGIKH